MFQRQLHLLRQGAHLPEVLRLILGAAVLLLLRQDGVGGPNIPGVEHHQILLEPPIGLRLHHDGGDRDLPVLVEADEVEAAEGRRILVLLPDRAAQLFDLHLAGLGGDLSFGEILPPIAVHRIQKPHGKGAGGAQPGSPRNIGGGGDLHPAELGFIQDAVEDAVLDLGKVSNQLALGIFQHGVLLVEVGVDGDVAIPIDGCAQYAAAVLFVKVRQVAPAAGKADAERGAGDNHFIVFFLVISFRIPCLNRLTQHKR